MNVRDKLPTRRNNPTKSENGKKWSKHKKDLRKDFNKSCGYCGSFDGFSRTYFEVDHFIPKDFFQKNGNIGLAQYSNLVYSCKFCNNNKLHKWPSQREDIFHINDEGFVDPCDNDYDNHLYRTSSGGILWKSDLGKWMAVKAFKFDVREKEIKLLWNFNQVRKAIYALIDLLNIEVVGSEAYNDIKLDLDDLYPKYFLYHKELMEFYASL